MRGEVLRYAGWQLVDRTGPRILVAALISSSLFALVYLASRHEATPEAQSLMVMRQMHSQFALLFALMLAHGIVSEDRDKGYYRFYLAKPVSPVWFYAQQVVIAFLGMLAASAVFIVAGGLALRSSFHWPLLLNATAVFLLLGLMIFMFSTLNRRDWLLATLVLIGSAIARGRWPAGRSRTGDVLNAVLPPNQLLGWNAEYALADWLWLGAWGIGMFAAGLMILRLRPLGED